jgi:hypothetical protein
VPFGTSFPGGSFTQSFGSSQNRPPPSQQQRPGQPPQSGFQAPPTRLFGFQPIPAASSDSQSRAPPPGFQPFQGFFAPRPQQFEQGFRPGAPPPQSTQVTRFGNPNVQFGPPGFSNSQQRSGSGFTFQRAF